MRLFALITATLLALAATDARAGGPGIDMYGNWCGPGTGSDNFPPIDPLDMACMRHDLCKDATSIANGDCDIMFMRELRSIPYPTESLYIRARAMYDAIAMMPCDDPSAMAEKQRMVWTDLADDFFDGRAMPFEMPMRWMHLFSNSRPDW
ncbi:MAG: hypothetical protein HQL35_12390 [Alphaproteobacteria bacterium]|nr:hypothetical protein [Alphaproteobacteria bacterium]